MAGESSGDASAGVNAPEVPVTHHVRVRSSGRRGAWPDAADGNAVAAVRMEGRESESAPPEVDEGVTSLLRQRVAQRLHVERGGGVSGAPPDVGFFIDPWPRLG
jgi:hypothetical protein